MCPILQRCKKASGIDCTDRDYEACDLYQSLLTDKNRKNRVRLTVAIPERMVM